MIDALFGSKTRVKLLHLFLSNPNQSFYVREITRKIDEQINSVRRELSNMINVGIVTCDGMDNKLYYQVNQRYEYYLPLKAIFSDDKTDAYSPLPMSEVDHIEQYSNIVKATPGFKLVIFAGLLVKGSRASVDILFSGSVHQARVKSIVSSIEKNEGREINYTVIPYEEFYYRLSVRDKFITDIVKNNHITVIDTDNILG